MQTLKLLYSMFNKNFDFTALKKEGIIENVIPLHNFYELCDNPIQPWIDNDLDGLDLNNKSLFIK